MNPAYLLGARLIDAFAKHGICTAIGGTRGGGKVETLSASVLRTDEGDTQQKGPTEIEITDRRLDELSRMGFLPLCSYKNTTSVVFFRGQTTHRPKT